MILEFESWRSRNGERAQQGFRERTLTDSCQRSRGITGKILTRRKFDHIWGTEIGGC